MKATTLGRSARFGKRNGIACGGGTRPNALQQPWLDVEIDGGSVPSPLPQQHRRLHPRWRGGRRLWSLAVAAERPGAKASGAGARASAGATEVHLGRGQHDRWRGGRHRHHRLRGCSSLARCGGFFVFGLHSRLRGVQQTSICGRFRKKKRHDEKRPHLFAMYLMVQTGQSSLAPAVVGFPWRKIARQQGDEAPNSSSAEWQQCSTGGMPHGSCAAPAASKPGGDMKSGI